MNSVRVKVAGAFAVVAVFVAAIVAGGGGGSPAGTAHLWVDSNGGSCTYNASPASYSDAAACASFDQAWDAASAGNTIRVVAGTYPEQVVTGDKASATYIIGEGDGDDVILGNGGSGADCGSANWSTLCANGAFLNVENVMSVVDDPGPYGGLSVNSPNVTVRDYSIRGAPWGDGNFKPSSIGVNAVGFVFDGGRIGRTDIEEQARCSHSSIQPIWLQSGGDNAIIRGVEVGRYFPKVEVAGPDIWQFCDPEQDGSYNPHIESIRAEDADNVTFVGNRFNGPSNSGSGHLYSSSDPDGWTFINNIFEDRGDLGAWNQMQIATPNNWAWYYNTFLDDGGRATNVTTEVFVGNYGYSPGCGTTNTANKYAGSGSCAGVTFIGATSLGVSAEGKLTSGAAPAVNSGETPGASDICTGSSVGSVDFDGDARPQSGNTNCTAGADEWTG